MRFQEENELNMVEELELSPGITPEVEEDGGYRYFHKWVRECERHYTATL